jgi:hypothetical protein
MKKIIRVLPLLLLLGSIVKVNAQVPDFAFTTYSGPRINFGVDAAIDFHFLLADATFSSGKEPQIGFSTRGWASIWLRDKLALQVGLGYALRRNDISMDSVILSSDINPLTGVVTYSTIDQDIAMHEIQLPVLLRYRFSSSEYGLYAAGGPFLGWVILGHSSGVVYAGNGTTESLNGYSFRQGLDPGLQACLGKTLRLGSAARMGVEGYGNIYAGKMRMVPARPCVAGLRLRYWF